MEHRQEIHIGEIKNIDSGKKEPLQIINITDDQFEVIRWFASTRKDKDLNTIYKLNDCEFKIQPHFKIK